MEVIFEYCLNKKLGFDEIDKLYDSFIYYIESYNLYHGGGTDKSYIRGGLYFEKPSKQISTISDLKNILRKFLLNHKDDITKLIFYDYESKS